MFAVTDDLSGGLGKFLGFMMFGVSDLVLVMPYGSNLVRGVYLTASASLTTRQARWREVLWEWSITHSGHWVGGFVVGWLIIVGASQAGSFGAPLMEVMAGIGEKKVSGHTWDELFYRAILANWLIAMGVWGAYHTKDVGGMRSCRSVAMAPLRVGALFLFVVEPALGITAGESGRN